MKHDGNQILIELTILFILVLIISLMFFVIKKKFCRKNFFVVLYIVILANHCMVGFPEIGNNIFQRYLNVREPNTNKKKLSSFGGIWSKSDNVYILIDSQEFICINYRNCQKLTCWSEKIPMENMGATVCTLLTDVLG